ncbi:metal-dependent hydrolase [Mangrovimonas aestuarii]|uniref:metal-dependent hydrolase n=1 Tax=Mangrovimonas aestuarii TaxID=3018443 RepID=UPI0023794C48|nr:metal-dependent hydrolase [Mangrovimonas aestuarii]
MDSLTQIVLGAAVGEAVLGKKVGNKAMLYGAIGGTIPDLDVLSSHFVDTVSALEFHRGVTHSILFCVLMSPLLGWLVSRWERSVNWKAWSWLFFAALVTHPILDAHTTWGTQLFWPLDLRLAFKNIFVIDPLYTLPFLVCLVIAMFQKRGSRKRISWNWLGIGLSSVYMLITIALKGITYLEFKRALDSQGIVYQEIETRPSPFNTIMWSANVNVKDGFMLADYSLFDSKPIAFEFIPKQEFLLKGLVDEDKVNRLKAITQGWYSVSSTNDKLYLNDLRFGLIDNRPGHETFAFSFLLEKTPNGLTVTEIPKNKDNAKMLMANLWQRIKGN